MMATRNTCASLTLRGRPCRNPARPGTDPPACALHLRKPLSSRPRPAADPELGDLRQLYLAGASAEELSWLATSGADAGLRPEVALVRLVLRRLLATFNERSAELPPDELRRIAGLVFTGARTVAQLLGRKDAAADEVQEWIDEEMKDIYKKYQVDL